MRRPKSDRKTVALELTGPRDSKAIGVNRFVLANSEYLVSFLSEADSAAPPACWDVMGRYDVASESTIVTSQIKLLPACQGIKVIPSGRLPSVLDSPDGSLVDGTPARDKPRQIKSLMWWWRAMRPELCLQDRPCVPLASACAPHGHS